jgi:hypothetical protein
MKNKLRPIEIGSKDINDHYEEFFSKMLELGTQLKVPGRKAKCK